MKEKNSIWQMFCSMLMIGCIGFGGGNALIPVIYKRVVEDEKLVSLAGGAGENMQSTYTYLEIERLLSRFGYLIYEHLNAAEATEQYFSDYNNANPSRPMKAPESSAYCLAVKKL